jgi:hypothetical protein
MAADHPLNALDTKAIVDALLMHKIYGVDLTSILKKIANRVMVDAYIKALCKAWEDEFGRPPSQYVRHALTIIAGEFNRELEKKYEE